MNDRPGDGERPRYVALRCAACGVTFRGRTWREGLDCPSCGARRVEPLSAPGGAVDYAAADRRQGTTSADMAFAEWARWCGYVTANQCNAAVHRQNSELQAGRPARPIHEVMISMGVLDEERATGLLRFLSRPRPDADDEDFVDRLLDRGDASPAEVRKAVALQGKMAARRNELPPIGQLLLRNRAITETQLLEVLRAEEADGVGALHTALTMSRPVPREGAVSGLARRAVRSPRAVCTLLAAVVLACLAWGVWAWQLKEEPVWAIGRCRQCRGIVKVEWTVTGWPAKCPRCGATAVRFAVKCPNGHIFTRQSPFTHERCPKCGSGLGYPLSEEDAIRLEQ